jgi:hypothetical protein
MRGELGNQFVPLAMDRIMKLLHDDEDVPVLKPNSYHPSCIFI